MFCGRYTQVGFVSIWTFVCFALMCALVLVQPCLSADQADQERFAALAESILEQTNLRRGVVAVLGADEFALELAQISDVLVHVRDPRADAVEKLRSQAAAAGVGIDRLIVERGTLAKLPYANNIVDLVVSIRSDELADLSMEEVLRVLRPGR